MGLQVDIYPLALGRVVRVSVSVSRPVSRLSCFALGVDLVRFCGVLRYHVIIFCFWFHPLLVFAGRGDETVTHPSRGMLGSLLYFAAILLLYCFFYTTPLRPALSWHRSRGMLLFFCMHIYTFGQFMDLY